MYKNASIFLNRKHRVFKKWENVKLKNRRYYIKKIILQKSAGI